MQTLTTVFFRSQGETRGLLPLTFQCAKEHRLEGLALWQRDVAKRRWRRTGSAPRSTATKMKV